MLAAFLPLLIKIIIICAVAWIITAVVRAMASQLPAPMAGLVGIICVVVWVIALILVLEALVPLVSSLGLLVPMLGG